MDRVGDSEERRQHARFSVTTNAFAFFGSRSAKLGQILDISEGGLSFSYLPGNERPYNSMELDILLPGGAFYLNGIPFETISDYTMKSEETPGARRCGIAFGSLSNKQRLKLDYFIEFFTQKQKAFQIQQVATSPDCIP